MPNPKITDEESTSPFKRGQDHKDMGRPLPKAPDQDSATILELEEYDEMKEGYESRDDIDPETGDPSDETPNAHRT